MSVQTRNLISEDLTKRSDMLIMRSDVLNWSFDSVELTSTSTLPEGFSDFPTLSNAVFGPMKSYGKASFTETEPCIDRNLIAQFFQCCRPEQRSYRHSIAERTGRHASLVKLERPSRFTTNMVTYSSLVGASGQYVNQVYRLIIQAPSLCKITKHAISSSSCTSSEIGLQTTPNYIWLSLDSKPNQVHLAIIKEHVAHTESTPAQQVSKVFHQRVHYKPAHRKSVSPSCISSTSTYAETVSRLTPGSETEIPWGRVYTSIHDGPCEYVWQY
ncbi:hypothetical protein CLF_110529 [Clonorchis sinensis]|uniref:Uncharacterized protein n=1 Tax=Clonorchis sinensis TaxID=79923 RepID=G7YTL7_CLOSI|nr:hypothetical protein CLF_110529 [Clonorchis sinensis]